MPNPLHAEKVPLMRLSPAQAKRRLASMEALRDVRVLGSIWHAANEETGLNANGRDVMKTLHSPIATIQHMWCSESFGPRLLGLVEEFLKESES